jgi:hypothetical protein
MAGRTRADARFALRPCPQILPRQYVLQRTDRHPAPTYNALVIFTTEERVMKKLLSTLAIGLFAVAVQAPSFAADDSHADAKAHKEMAKGDYKATKEKADAHEKAAKEECSKLSGADEHACKERAEANAKKTKANAKANYEDAKAQSKSMK